jgi:hypothetical protein
MTVILNTLPQQWNALIQLQNRQQCGRKNFKLNNNAEFVVFLYYTDVDIHRPSSIGIGGLRSWVDVLEINLDFT